MQTSENNDDEHYLDVVGGDELLLVGKDSDGDEDHSDDDYGENDVGDGIFDKEIAKRVELRANVVKWALDNNTTHGIIKGIIKGIISIINDYCGKPVLSRDARTLLRTPRAIQDIREIGENQYYWHNGLQYCLENLLCNVSKPLTISLNINMDGLPIYKSARDELWPILFNIFEFPRVKPMVIGVYHGVSKASNLESYLLPMVEELKSLMEQGVEISGHKITVKLRCFICDSSARAFIKGESTSIYMIYIIYCCPSTTHTQTLPLG